MVELLPRPVTGLLALVVEPFYVESSESRLRHITLPYKPREFTMRIEYRHQNRHLLQLEVALEQLLLLIMEH